MTYRIAKRFTFSASHQLDEMPEGHQCRRLHGHNYEVEVVLSCSGLDARGMVVDYGDLDDLRALIDTLLDHRHLNDVIDGHPTAERLAAWIFARCPTAWRHLVEAVRVSETPRTWAEYRP